MEFVLPLFGRFHPLFVHLPIGILFFGIVLVFLADKNKGFTQVLPFTFLIGAISAFLSSISGFLQYQYEGYTWETVQLHLILGWCTVALAGWLAYSFRKTTAITKSSKVQAAGLFLLLTGTGHLGGNITHGSDYLFEVLPPGLQEIFGFESIASKPLELPLENWEEIAFYEGAIQPILNHNCTSCHNPKNLKGELDLSTAKGLLAGGEDGQILFHGDLEKSELYSRLILPKDNEEHMPPKEKRQPQKAELELLKIWIESGAKMDQTLGEAKVPVSVVSSFFPVLENPFYPETTLNPIPEDSLSILREKGFFIEMISKDNPLVRLSCINFSAFEDKDWASLKSISNHIAYLDLSNTKASGAIIDSLGTLPNLTVLKLNGLPIDGSNFENFGQFSHLKLLYLNATEVGMEKLKLLDQHPSLQKVFVFKTPASSEEKGKFSFELETGDFLLPKLPTDTIIY